MALLHMSRRSGRPRAAFRLARDDHDGWRRGVADPAAPVQSCGAKRLTRYADQQRQRRERRVVGLHAEAPPIPSSTAVTGRCRPQTAEQREQQRDDERAVHIGRCDAGGWQWFAASNRAATTASGVVATRRSPSNTSQTDRMPRITSGRRPEEIERPADPDADPGGMNASALVKSPLPRWTVNQSSPLQVQDPTRDMTISSWCT
jgi:hypothetical protein